MVRGTRQRWESSGRRLAAVMIAGALVSAAVGSARAGAPAKAAVKVAPLEAPDWKKLGSRKVKLDDFVAQVGHSRAVSSVSFTKDAALMATASGFDDGTVKVWELGAKRLLRTLDGEDHVSLSPDGKFVASGNVGGPIKIWSVDGWELVKELDGAGPISFTPDGKYLVGEALPDEEGGEGRLVRWTVGSWKASKPLAGSHEAALTAISISKDGRFVATGSFDESIKIWDMQGEGELIRTFKEGVKSPAALALSPDGERLAVSYREGEPTVELWDVSASKIERALAHPKYVTQLSFSPDGATLATAALDDRTRLFDPATGSEKTSFAGGGQVAYAPTGALLVTGKQALTLRSADGATVEGELAGNTALVFQTVFSQDGAKLVTTDATSRVDVWDVATGKLERSMKIDNGEGDDRVGELILSPRGTYVARRPFEGAQVRIWEVGSGEVAHDLDLSELGSLRGVTFAPNEKELVLESPSGEDRTSIAWWDLEANKQLNGTRIAGYVSVEGFIDGGKNVALVSTGTNTGKARLSLKLWDRETGLLQSVKVEGIPPFAGDLDFAGEGDFIALGDTDNTIKLWSREGKKISATLSKHDDLVNLVTFSPDGRLLATGSWDETVRIWGVSKGEALLTLDGILYKAQHITFSPAGDLVAISHKGWLRLLHLPTGRARTLYRTGGEGWLAYDSTGRFDCAGDGCELATYHTKKGDHLEAGDKRVRKLKGLETFGR